MKITLRHTSCAAATSFSKDDRVIVRLAKNDWLVGTVTRAGVKLHVAFDDGSTATVESTDFKHVKLLLPKFSAKTRKKSLDDEGARALFKASGIAPEKKATKIIISKPLKAKAVKVAKPKDADEEVTSEEQFLKKKIGSSLDYSSVLGNRVKMLRFLNAAWTRANIKLFSSTLPNCSIRLSKDMGTVFKRRGSWSPGRRVISISPRLFQAMEEHVLSTLVHEMCHQWVTDIDKVNDRSLGGHGPHWQSIMKKVGLTPSRYSKYDNETFLNAEEKASSDRVNASKKKAAEEAVGKGLKPLRYWDSNVSTPAQWHDPRNNAWIKGLIVGKHDQAGKRWIFIRDYRTSTWDIIPTSYFYELPDAEKATYTTDAFRSRAREILNYKGRKSDARAAKREMRKGIFGRWDS